MRLKKLTEGWKELPPIDREKYQPRGGLEGPIQTLSGKVVYYDPKAGKYIDPDTDMYLSYDDFRALDNEYSGMKESSSDDNKTYAKINYDYSEDWASIELYKDGKKVEDWDDYFGANETGNPLAKQYIKICKKHGVDPMSLKLVDGESGRSGSFNGKTFKWEDSVSEEQYNPKTKQYTREGSEEENYITVAVSSARKALEALADARIEYEADGSNHYIFADEQDVYDALELFNNWGIEVEHSNLELDEGFFSAKDRYGRYTHPDAGANDEGWDKPRGTPGSAWNDVDPNKNRHVEIRIGGKPWKVVAHKNIAFKIKNTLEAKGKQVELYYTDEAVSESVNEASGKLVKNMRVQHIHSGNAGTVVKGGDKAGGRVEVEWDSGETTVTSGKYLEPIKRGVKESKDWTDKRNWPIGLMVKHPKPEITQWYKWDGQQWVSKSAGYPVSELDPEIEPYLDKAGAYEAERLKGMPNESANRKSLSSIVNSKYKK